MNTSRTFLKNFFSSHNINWQLLVFLVLFLNVKLLVKIVAVVLLYCFRPGFRFGFRWKNPRLPLFYPIIIGLALLNAVYYQSIFQKNYLFVLLFGIGIWMLCLLCSHQVKAMVAATDTTILYRTLAVFFVLNAGVSAIQYLRIVLETGAINPFRYQGNYQKYFIRTGDYIKDLSFDTSTTNAVLNAFGAVFFLYTRNWLLLLICTCTLLVTGSNLVNIVLYTTLLLLFLFRSTREQKSMMVVCGALLAVFVTKVSPQNNQYVVNVLEKALRVNKKEKTNPANETDVRNLPDAALTMEQRKEKTALASLDSLRKVVAERLAKRSTATPSFATNYLWAEKLTIPEPSIYSAPFQSRNDTSAYRLELLRLMASNPGFHTQDLQYEQSTLPGKLLAALQTGAYLRNHPQQLLTGTGLGTFSSKMAFKATALQFAGGFPSQLAYINPAFSVNHLSLYAHFFSKRANAHSITNSPNSVYDQLLSEYGLPGLVSFLLFYVGFFAKHYKRLTYGLPLLFLLLNVLFFDYWFEQLSILVAFELLLFLNLKEGTQA